MIRKKVKHIYFKSFIDNADIINTHNYFTSYSEFFNNKNWRDGNGRKPKADIVKEWRLAHPEGRKADCIRDTGLDKKTVYKWWE